VKASAITRPVLLPRRAWAAVLVILLVTAALIGGFRLNRELSLKPGPDQYNIGEWEIRNAPQKWLFLLGEFIRGEPPLESQEAHLRRFFQLTREISAREAQISDLEQRGEAVPTEDMALLEMRRRRCRAGTPTSPPQRR
jgi:hypothetical protein